MAIEKNYKQIALARLVLNPENDRFEPVINEEEAIEMMLLKLGTKIFNLASDIIRRGLSKKPFYVISTQDGKNISKHMKVIVVFLSILLPMKTRI